jgi:hypothetical protein
VPAPESPTELAAPRQAQAEPAAARPTTTPDVSKPSPAQIKLTIYLSKEQVDALEETVFRRRRAGERIGNTDVMREIVDAWMSRQSD